MSDLHKMMVGTEVSGRAGPINLGKRMSEIKRDARGWLADLGKNGYAHAERLEEYLDKLTQKLRESSSIQPAEAFILLCAVYMHDVGYRQGDRLVAEGHPDRSHDMIMSSPDEFLLGDFQPMPGRPPRVAEAVAWLCKGHSEERDVPLSSIPFDFGDQSMADRALNLRRLAAYLRVADEADDPYVRLVDDSFHPVRGRTPLVALEIDRRIGDVRGEGADQGNMGSAYAMLGEYTKAQECFGASKAIFRRLGLDALVEKVESMEKDTRRRSRRA